MSDTRALPTDTAQAPPPVIPDVDLVRRIGRGGFGEVWLGINRATGGLKAVKIIPLRGHAADPAGREVVSLAQLEAQRVARHPNLLDIQHVGRTADVLFYLMDPADDVSGRPLTTPCTATGILPGLHRVAFRHPQRGQLDAGVIDFTTTREVVARW